MTGELVGIIGAGQLGRMLALAGSKFNLRFRFWGSPRDTSCDELGEVLRADWSDSSTLKQFCQGLHVATYEFENVPEECARQVADKVPLFPGPQALAVAQDRFTEKSFFRTVGMGTTEFMPVDSISDLKQAAQDLGLPLVLKTRRMGYDGKGQAIVRAQHEIEGAFAALHGVPLIAEAFVAFERELSIIAVRSKSGELKFYPLVQNYHHSGILRLSLAPAGEIDAKLQSRAELYAQKVLEGLDYVGVLAIEFFLHKGELLGNEMAPRVHNSGHWSIDASATSQFENHLRAILGLPLGATTSEKLALMINLIGNEPQDEALSDLPQAHLHLYNKSPAAGRKLGHLTVTASELEQLQKLTPRLDRIIDHASALALRNLLRIS